MAKAKKNWIEYAKTPEEVGVSSYEIQAFIDECMEKKRELHSITIIRHGKIACEIYREPFTREHRHMMYSVSKSFTSTAIGFAVDEGYMTVDKGSVTVNGVSLTVCEPTDDSFSVAIIPYTYEHTNFHTIEVGTKVNIEFDIIGKYIARMIKR